MTGFVCVDKPAGPTSHDVVDAVRRALGTRKVGHAGTLDPPATGLLVCGVGKATRLLRFLSDLPKVYETTGVLGVRTTTLDATGEVTDERPVDVDRDAVEGALGAFRGEIEQVPPQVSAVKVDGERAYRRAARGEDVELEPRPVVVHSLETTAFEPPRLALRIACSSGTYVRSLVADLGDALGCGAHVETLRRTSIGHLEVADAVGLDELGPGVLLGVEAALAHLDRTDVDADTARRASQGQRVEASAGDGEVLVVGPDGPIGVFASQDGMLRPVTVLVSGGSCVEVLHGVTTPPEDGRPPRTKPAVTTIGTFDAVHRGHQALFRRVVEEADRLDASATVLTFDRHPIEVLAPEKAPCRLGTLEQRLAAFEELGIDRTLVLTFDRELASLEPEAFVSDVLVGNLGVRKVVVGADFRFGHRRRGDVELLRELGEREGFDVEPCELVRGEDGAISSTHIRELVTAGRVEDAAALLGRDYRLEGRVVHGAGRGGAELGFPTANLEPHERACLPGNGVYAAWWRWEGRRLPGAVNVGVRPTFTPDPQPVVEIHVIDFSGDLYGATGEIEFHSRLRDELRFDSVEELVEQMHADVADARRRLGT